MQLSASTVRRLPTNLKETILPNELSDELAEFIGAYLGDGTLTPYFMRISGDKRHDKPYFEYLSKLIYALFSIEPTIRSETETNQLYLELRSKTICDFLRNEFGLVPGNKLKNGNHIPSKIFEVDRFATACLRGLVDTDGCICRDGAAFTVRFASKSPILFNQAYDIGRRTGVFSFKTRREVGTRSWAKINKYFQLVGSSNLRHVIRFCEHAKSNPLYKYQLQEYYSKYAATKLPFYGPVVDKITESQD